jgi:hypothetical protein
MFMEDNLQCILDRRRSQKYLPLMNSFYRGHDAYIRMYWCGVGVGVPTNGLADI